MSEQQSGRPSSAMILAAGYGKRMRPLTDDRPKPLVEFAGRPLIDHVLDRLSQVGICKAVVNTHYKGDMLKAHLAGRASPRLGFSDESDALLDTGGGIKKALDQLGPEAFFVHNSDSVWKETPMADKSNMERMVAYWNEGKMDSLLMLADATASIGYDGLGDFSLEADGRLQRRQGDKPVPFVFTGVSIVHPRLFRGAPTGAFSIIELWDRAIRDGRLFGMRFSGTWMHVGTPQALKEAEGALNLERT